VAENIGPPLDRYARQMKTLTKNSEVRMAGGGSAWLRDGSLFFNINGAEDGIGFGGVFIYQINEAGNGLVAVGQARSADVDVFNNWRFDDYGESVFLENRTVVNDQPTSLQPSRLNPDVLELTKVRTSSLSGSELYRYIDYLKSNGLDAKEYEIAFWGRMAGIVGVAIMCVLAVPFVMGSLRDSGAGSRMLVGVGIGLGYFLLNSTVQDSTEVFDLSPVLMGWLPTITLGLLTALLLARTR
jgi:lipopolysaccharide export system permease protein